MKDINVKQAFSDMIKEDMPEMTQEEAIKNYKEDDTIGRPTKKKHAAEDDNTEESEHLKRIKKELLASLERVKQLAKKIYKEDNEKTKLNVKQKNGTTGGKTKKIEPQERVMQEKDQDRERE